MFMNLACNLPTKLNEQDTASLLYFLNETSYFLAKRTQNEGKVRFLEEDGAETTVIIFENEIS